MADLISFGKNYDDQEISDVYKTTDAILEEAYPKNMRNSIVVGVLTLVLAIVLCLWSPLAIYLLVICGAFFLIVLFLPKRTFSILKNFLQYQITLSEIRIMQNHKVIQAIQFSEIKVVSLSWGPQARGVRSGFIDEAIQLLSRENGEKFGSYSLEIICKNNKKAKVRYLSNGEKRQMFAALKEKNISGVVFKEKGWEDVHNEWMTTIKIVLVLLAILMVCFFIWKF